MTEHQNIKQIAEGRYQIQFRYTDPTTGERKNLRRSFLGTLGEAVAERDRLMAVAKNGELFGSNADQDGNGR
ncbi:hypothetical protein FIV42_15440 [Persicimonas caeni]|uniref:Uncharacterized protein n=1 Tax=Persicimonas caeni TaxID=2292766 RepID=A0A4Y6PWH1_PERCE|nr:hypothetical protein [Persicimonas caeni]QDG52085.1 hypothetical protein FIV42_15440 [Persicimonas caeni]QED33306.1 hypothetical protein FRD00_15435 [Persicimonas caeni]